MMMMMMIINNNNDNLYFFYLQLYTISNKFHKNRFQFNSWTEFTTSTYAKYKETRASIENDKISGFQSSTQFYFVYITQC